MFNDPSTVRRAKKSCKYLVLIFSIVACRNVSAEQTFVPTVVGDWLVEETHDVAPYVRQSGRDGLASVLLAPLDRNIYKNTFFSISCVDSRIYLNINLLINSTPDEEGKLDATAVLNGFVFSTTENDANVYRHSYVEHEMLKAEVGEDFLQSFRSSSPTTINLVTKNGNTSFVYNNRERARATSLFLGKCGNFKSS